MKLTVDEWCESIQVSLWLALALANTDSALVPCGSCGRRPSASYSTHLVLRC
jgi:hypothetical protein